jgi:hypothetical protein
LFGLAARASRARIRLVRRSEDGRLRLILLTTAGARFANARRFFGILGLRPDAQFFGLVARASRGICSRRRSQRKNAPLLTPPPCGDARFWPTLAASGSLGFRPARRSGLLHVRLDAPDVGNARARPMPTRCTRCNVCTVTGTHVHVRSYDEAAKAESIPQRTFDSSAGSTASVAVAAESGGAALRQVPRIDPMMISGNPMARPTVMGSSRMRAPKRMATTGLM